MKVLARPDDFFCILLKSRKNRGLAILFLQDFLKNEDFQKLIYAKLRTMAVVDKDGYAKSKDDFLKNMEQLSLNLPQEISASSMKSSRR